MKISLGETPFPCRNCGRPFPPSQLDRRFWCPDCRAAVIRRASTVARLCAFFIALALAAWIYYLVGPAPRFLVAYIVMVIAAYFFVYKLTQRVAFEVIRARGVPPPVPSPEPESATTDDRSAADLTRPDDPSAAGSTRPDDRSAADPTRPDDRSAPDA